MLPDILSPGSTRENWPGRRDELVELFRTHVFGRKPDLPFSSRAERLYRVPALDGNATRELHRVTIATEQGSICLHLALVLPHSDGPVPAVLMLSNHDKTPAPASPPDLSAVEALMAQAPQAWRESVQKMMAGMQKNGAPAPQLLDIEKEDDANYWPVADIVASGRAAAAFYASEAQPDSRACFPGALTALFTTPDTPRPADGWGTLSVWAFAASRMVDVLCEHASIDASRISLAGHSRGGKTALWAAAQDDRIRAVLVNNSGCTGAALSRGKRGETVASINAFFPHWFCPNYAQYAWQEEKMPFDQHMLLAAVAPRLCYVTSGSEDLWSDPDAEWQGAVCASKAWQLFGDAPLGGPRPPAGVSLPGSRIGYHCRAGGHDLTAWDWAQFLHFLELHHA